MVSVSHSPVAVYTDVVDTDPSEGVALLQESGFEVRILRSDDPAVIAAQAPDAVALLTGYTRVDEALLDVLPRLRIVATQSAGVDTVDLAAAERRGVWVANVPDAATDDVAAHALAMVLALLRGLPFLDRDVRAGIWDGTRERLRRPASSTLGVVGLGRIGRRLVDVAAPALGEIVGFDPHLGDVPNGVRPVPLRELLACSDVVSLHVPLNAHTQGLLDEAALSQMKPGASLVNVARGGLVDHAALLRHLDDGRLSSAALDVLRDEPPAHDDPLLGHPRVLLSPHAAYMSESSMRDYVLRQAHNVCAWYTHGEPDTAMVGPSSA